MLRACRHHTGSRQANISDCIRDKNIFSFGTCQLSPDIVAPCTYGICGKWVKGKENYTINGELALLKTSFNVCSSGGIISIINDGQIGPDSMHIGEGGRTTNMVSGEEYDYSMYADKVATSDMSRLSTSRGKSVSGGILDPSKMPVVSVTKAAISTQYNKALGQFNIRKDYKNTIGADVAAFSIADMTNDGVTVEFTVALSNVSGSTLYVKGQSEVLGNSEELGFSTTSNQFKFTVKFKSHKLKNGGIKKYAIPIKWYYSADNKATWNFANQTNVTIYMVLQKPKAPWKCDDGGGDQQPWATALDYACEWAAGATTVDGAVTKIANKLFHSCKLFYEMNWGDAPYWGPKEIFFLEGMINWINDGKKIQVKCNDTVSAIVSFANVVGANLVEGHIEDPNFKDIMLVGHNKAQSIGWGSHSLAFRGSASSSSKIVDICFRGKEESNPPSNITFSDYVYRYLSSSVRIKSNSGGTRKVGDNK